MRTLRQQSPIFIWSLTMRWGCSAGLLVNGTAKSAAKRHTWAARVCRRRATV